MATLKGIYLGNLQEEKQTKFTDLFGQTRPGADSDESILLDLFGVNRDVPLSGVFTGTKSEINAFIDEMENIQNGRQTPIDFQSDLRPNPIKVLMSNFEWVWKKGSPRVLEYTLTLKQGSL